MDEIEQSEIRGLQEMKDEMWRLGNRIANIESRLLGRIRRGDVCGPGGPHSLREENGKLVVVTNSACSF